MEPRDVWPRQGRARLPRAGQHHHRRNQQPHERRLRMSGFSASPAPDALPFRAAPHNLEAEQALLGAILVNNEAIDRVSGFLEPQHFFDALHAKIYEAVGKLIATGQRATPITLKTFFENAEPVGPALVPAYLGQLAANATTIINVRDYARTVYDLAVRR